MRDKLNKIQEQLVDIIDNLQYYGVEGNKGELDKLADRNNIINKLNKIIKEVSELQ